MALVDTYRQYIIENIMLFYLKDGIIPTSDTIQSDFSEYIKTHSDLSMPLSSISDFDIERGSSSSASKIKEIAKIVHQDTSVLSKEIYRLAQESSKYYDRWSFEAKRLSARARQLEQRIDSLLLLKNDTAGFFNYVGDTFSNMNLIDIENSKNIKTNITEGYLSISPLRTVNTDASRGTQIDLTEITNQNISFYTITNRRGTSVNIAPGENELKNIFKTDNSSWNATVTAGKTGDMVCELKFKMSDKDISVSKTSMEFTAPAGTTKSTISLQYSQDGYKWFLVPAVDATKVLQRRLAWTFRNVNAKWMKFIIRKAAPDEGLEYKFGISHVKVYKDSFDSSINENILISKPQYAKNAEEKIVRFSQVSLDACSEVPNSCGINYYISASKDNSVWTDWLAIASSDNTSITRPKILNIGGVSWKDNNDSSNYYQIDSSKSSQKILTRNFSNTVLPGLSRYNFKESNSAVINTAIVLSPNQDPDPIAETVVLWRNVRYKDINNYPDTKLVRGIERGWGSDGGKYSCFFEVISSDGIILDFGGTTCTIDDVQVSGVIKISKGVHKFITDSENWFNISDNIISYLEEEGASINSEEILKIVDPLYPYNHKLLIEGFPYGTSSSFSGERLYKGTDISAEFYSKKISLFDLENNSTNYGEFAVRGVGNETNPILAVLINFNNSNPDYTNELFSLKWRAGDSDSDMYSYVKFKAEFWTEDSALTPRLDSYRIKLGI